MSHFNLSLLHCQKNFEVPEIQLIIDPEIKKRVIEAKAKGTKEITVELFEDKLKDKNWTSNLGTIVTK